MVDTSPQDIYTPHFVYEDIFDPVIAARLHVLEATIS
ncbi:MAG: hypothetical protein JWP13_432, partial [Candidatus Saccharibacteria bacterium]|nr:hypothetical protein [Candidatus Saccharibacteria bacterium]